MKTLFASLILLAGVVKADDQPSHAFGNRLVLPTTNAKFQGLWIVHSNNDNKFPGIIDIQFREYAVTTGGDKILDVAWADYLGEPIYRPAMCPFLVSDACKFLEYGGAIGWDKVRRQKGRARHIFFETDAHSYITKIEFQNSAKGTP